MLNQSKNILSLLRCRILIVSASQHSEVNFQRWKRSEASLQMQLMMWTMYCEQFHLLRPWGEEQQARGEPFRTFGRHCRTPKPAGNGVKDTRCFHQRQQHRDLVVRLTLCSQGGTSLSSAICRLSCTTVQFLLSGLAQWIYWYQNKVPPKAK